MWRFTITDNTTGGTITVIDEPVGWDGITIRFKRDPTMHGFFEFMDEEISTLQFDGIGNSILVTAFEDFGIEADVQLTIEYQCGSNAYEELWTGQFDFSAYTSICGDRCYVQITITSTSCLKKFRNRFDQKVNIETGESYNGTTLMPYDNLFRTIELPPVEIILSSKGIVPATESVHMIQNPAFEPPDPNAYGYLPNGSGGFLTGIRQGVYSPLIVTEVKDFPDFIGGLQGHLDGNEIVNGSYPLEIYQFDGTPICGSDNIDIEVAFAGRFYDSSGATRALDLKLQVFYGADYIASTHANAGSEIVIGYTDTVPHDDPFNYTWSGSFSLTPGQKIWVVFFLNAFKSDSAQYDPILEITSGSIMLTSNTLCEPTEAVVHLVNETASRVTESITDDCLRVYSDYFGREDAEPYPSDVTGCGALKVLTNGLAIRNARMLDGSEPKFTFSMKDIFEGLNAIDNIGMGLEPDPNRPGQELLRIERYPYFYQDDIIFNAVDVAQMEVEVQEGKYISKVLIGYSTWETESVNGAFDIHTSREYRTPLTTVRNTHDRLCKFIASGFTIEITRREVGKTTKDWRYDNNTFIICIKPQLNPDVPYVYEVEQGWIDPFTSENIPDPVSMYNMRISPVRNAMRHLNTVLQSYIGTTGTLYFSAGEGNLVAASQMFGAPVIGCFIEDELLRENQDIDLSLYTNPEDYYPVFSNELARFEYPMSYDQFKIIKANPYGRIQFNCYNGPVLTGWIENMRYAPESGIASFEVKPKHQA